MIVLTLLLGLILRIIGINQSFWIDEATSGNVVRNFSFLEIITKFSPGDFHPPFYYLALKIWSIVFGTSEMELRLMSVFFAICTIYLVYKIAEALTKTHSKYIAALLLATAPLHIYYSQEARMYALETFLVTLSVYLFIKKRWIFFSLALVLVGMTDYLPLLIIPVFWIMGKNVRQKLLFSHLPLLGVFFLWSSIFIKQLQSGLSVKITSPQWWDTLGKTNLKEVILLPVKFMMGRISFDNKMVYGVVVGLLFLLFGYILVRVIRENKLIWMWLILPVFFGIIIGFKLSVFTYFRFLFVIPAFYLLIGQGLASIKNKRFKNLLILVVLSLNIIFSFTYLTTSRFHRENWKEAARFIINSSVNQSSVVVFPTNSQMEALKYYQLEIPIVSATELKPVFKKMWLVRYAKDISDPKDTAKTKIEGMGYRKVNEYDFNGVVVWKYEID